MASATTTPNDDIDDAELDQYDDNSTMTFKKPT